jgi:lysophospholipase L1-like esterase
MKTNSPKLWALALTFALFNATHAEPLIEGAIFKNNDTICLIGDSITHSGPYHSYVFLYYATRFPQMRLKFINCGISGDSASGMMGRLKRDVFSNNATVATLSAGMNDVNRGLYSQTKVPADAENSKRKAIDGFKKNIQKISDALSEKGVRQIFITPTIYDENFESTVESLRGVNAALGECSDFVIELGKTRNIPVVDFWHPMNEINTKRQQADPQFTLIGKDRIHPGPVGHMVMAYLFLDQTNAPQDVWRLSIDAKSKKVMEQKNADATNIEATPSGLAFSNKEMALPFPLIEDAKAAYDLVPFMDRLNQQVLQIRNLAPRNYTLKINSTDVGIYSQGDLENGINLATNSSTPQNVLGQKIAALCKEHQSLGSTIRMLRRVEMKHLAGVDLSDKEGVKAKLEAFITEKQAQKNDPGANSGYYITTARTYLKESGNEDAMRARIQAIEDEIYTINQPQTFSYSLERTADPQGPLNQ